MIIDRPTPFAEAVRVAQNKGILPNDLNSAQLAKLEAEIRRTATFSARMNKPGFLKLLNELLEQIVSPRSRAPGTSINRAKAKEQLFLFLEKIGYTPEAGKEGTIEDLKSNARLDLIVRTNSEMQFGRGQFMQANDPKVIQAFPAQELFRLQDRVDKRDWLSIWVRAGGKTFEGGKDPLLQNRRLIALKNSPIWLAISEFGNPYPPYKFNSGMWTKPVSRIDAETFGLITPNDIAQPHKLAGADLQASVASLPDLLAKALVDSFDGGAIIENGVLKLLRG